MKTIFFSGALFIFLCSLFLKSEYLLLVEKNGGLGGRIYLEEYPQITNILENPEEQPPSEIVYNFSGKPEILKNSEFIQLSGKLILFTYPGYPNYESLANGDNPDPCWILELDQESCDYMWSRPITDLYKKYFPEDIGDYNLELTLHPFDNNALLLNNKRVIIQGYLGSLVMHVHTPFILEVVKLTYEQ